MNLTSFMIRADGDSEMAEFTSELLPASGGQSAPAKGGVCGMCLFRLGAIDGSLLVAEARLGVVRRMLAALRLRPMPVRVTLEPRGAMLVHVRRGLIEAHLDSPPFCFAGGAGWFSDHLALMGCHGRAADKADSGAGRHGRRRGGAGQACRRNDQTADDLAKRRARNDRAQEHALTSFAYSASQRQLVRS